MTLWISILTHVFAAVFGGILGAVLSTGKVKIFKRDVAVPYVKHNDRNFTLLVMLLVVAALIAVAITAVQGYVQGKCNQEFRSSLAARSQIATEDNGLAKQSEDVGKQNDALNKSDRDALQGFVNDLVAVPPLPVEERLRRLQGLNTIYQENNLKRNVLDEQQKVLDQRRAQLADDRAAHPVADPQCGS